MYDSGDDGSEQPCEVDNNNVEAKTENSNEPQTTETDSVHIVVRRAKKGNLKAGASSKVARRVSFDPLALLLDASLEGELELVRKTATQVSIANCTYIINYILRFLLLPLPRCHC